MQIIIDIDEDDYKLIKDGSNIPSNLRDLITASLFYRIRNGKLLPKGHGRLIDAEKLISSFPSYDGMSDVAKTIDYAPTIIEADTETIKALDQESCEDCISRQSVLNALCNDCELYKNEKQTCFSKCEEYHFLVTLPSVQPKIEQEPKTGHWNTYVVYQNGIDEEWLECSECKWSNALVIPRKYCPNCGAKMTESEE